MTVASLCPRWELSRNDLDSISNRIATEPANGYLGCQASRIPYYLCLPIVFSLRSMREEQVGECGEFLPLMSRCLVGVDDWVAPKESPVADLKYDSMSSPLSGYPLQLIIATRREGNAKMQHEINGKVERTAGRAPPPHRCRVWLPFAHLVGSWAVGCGWRSSGT